MRKPTVCVDFDGVLNEYSGYNPTDLGKPKVGCKEFLQELSKNYSVVILSARSFNQIEKWLIRYDLWDFVENVTSWKPPAVAYIDDRGIRFDGDYSHILIQLENFKPYWK